MDQKYLPPRMDGFRVYDVKKKVTRILWLRWVPVLTIDPGDTALLECRESTRGAGYDGIASACD